MPCSQSEPTCAVASPHVPCRSQPVGKSATWNATDAESGVKLGYEIARWFAGKVEAAARGTRFENVLAAASKSTTTSLPLMRSWYQVPAPSTIASFFPSGENAGVMKPFMPGSSGMVSMPLPVMRCPVAVSPSFIV